MAFLLSLSLIGMAHSLFEKVCFLYYLHISLFFSKVVFGYVGWFKDF